MSRMIQQHKRKDAAGTDPYVTDRDLDIEEVPTADVRVAGRRKRADGGIKRGDTVVFQGRQCTVRDTHSGGMLTLENGREGNLVNANECKWLHSPAETSPSFEQRLLDASETDADEAAEYDDYHNIRYSSQKRAGKKRANSKGKYVTLIQTPTNKLEIVPNPTTIAQFVDENRDHLPTDVLTALEGFETPGERRYNVWGDDQTLYELMGDFLSNGWQNVDPEEISALTDAPIFEAPDGRIYWHERYQVESAAEELVLGKTVMFDGAPENKAPVAKTTVPGDAAEDDNDKKESSVKRAAWKSRLRDNYDNDFEQFQSYAETYGLLQRLGFSSAEEAWEANPIITGSTDPKDFRVVPERGRRTPVKRAGYGEVFDEPWGDEGHQRHELEEQCAGCGGSDGLKLDSTGHTLCQKCRQEASDNWDRNAGTHRFDTGGTYGRRRASAKTAFEDAPIDADPMPDDTMDDDDASLDPDMDAPIDPEPPPPPAAPVKPPAPSNVFEKWQTQNLIDTIEALTDSETFASDKAEQKSVEQMAEILSARPVERNNEDVKQAAVKMAKTALSKVRPKYLGIEAAVKSAAEEDEDDSVAKEASQSDAPPQDGDTGKHLEGDTSIPRGADFDEDHTGIPDVPTTLPKEATVPTTGSALKTTESMIDKLKALYLEAKPIVGVNGTRPVREGVEAIYHAMHALGETQKILSKQLKQEEDDEKAMADKEKAKQKGKASSLIGNLILAPAEI